MPQLLNDNQGTMYDSSIAQSAPQLTSVPPTAPQPDDLTRIFNTSLVATRVDACRDYSAELFRLMETPAFRAILAGVRQLARSQGISEKEAAENVVQTFRKVDQIWDAYLTQEGVDRLKGLLSSNPSAP